jgi:D-amino-acid dehydrogenase
LKELSLFSKASYQQLASELPFDFDYHERGLLMPYQTAAAEHEEAETATLANRHGVAAKVLSRAEVQTLEPEVRVDVRGGVFFPGDAHLTPHLLVRGLIQCLKSVGVKIHSSTRVLGFSFRENAVTGIQTTAGEFICDQMVLATGSWSGEVARQLDLRLPMQAGKGYSFTINEVEKNVRIPSILLEARVAVTPMANTLRFGGTMEISGVNHDINLQRVRGIVEAIPRYYPQMEVAMPEREKIWHGLRPCSPDGLPYIGRLKRLPNVVVATGHAMMGLSLAPGTGKLVAELMSEETPSVSLSAFEPGRFAG